MTASGLPARHRLGAVDFLLVLAVAAVVPGCAGDHRSSRTSHKLHGDRPEVSAEAVLIPGGQTAVRSTGGVHAPSLSFLMDKTEVTVAAYERCVASGACTPAGSAWDTCNWPKKSSRGAHPINCVDWTQAAAYCHWVGKRLPTEAEWEYSARGPGARTYPWGEEPPSRQLCWEENPDRMGEQSTCPVGSYPEGASPYGLLDMAGNVWEWTSSVEQLPNDVDAYVLRGGGWSNDGLSPIAEVRTFDREVQPPSHSAGDVGFRCAGTP